MILAFASDDNNGLDGVLSYHFGRCPYYTFVEVEGKDVKNVFVEPNPSAETHNPGDIPQFIASKGANVVFAGGMGPRAQEWFAQLGVQPIAGAYGKIKDLITQFLNSIPEELPSTNTVPETPQIAEGTESENKQIERLQKEVAHLREVIADINSRLQNIETKKS